MRSWLLSAMESNSVLLPVQPVSEVGHEPPKGCVAIGHPLDVAGVHDVFCVFHTAEQRLHPRLPDGLVEQALVPALLAFLVRCVTSGPHCFPEGLTIQQKPTLDV